MVPMFESEFEDNTFRRRLMKEVAPDSPVHLSFYSPSVKVQVQPFAEHLPGANGRYIGDAVTIEFVPEDAAAVERVRGVDKRAAAKAAEAVDHEELRALVGERDVKTLARVPGLGEKRARAVVEFYENEG